MIHPRYHRVLTVALTQWRVSVYGSAQVADFGMLFESI